MATGNGKDKISTTDSSVRIVDEISKICNDLRKGQGIEALWKAFNIMAAYIRTQAMLVARQDSAIKELQRDRSTMQKRIVELERQLENWSKTIDGKGD